MFIEERLQVAAGQYESADQLPKRCLESSVSFGGIPCETLFSSIIRLRRWYRNNHNNSLSAWLSLKSCLSIMTRKGEDRFSMMQSHFKACPRCGLQTTLDTPICAGCGRQYQTQFPSQPQQFNSTGVFPSTMHLHAQPPNVQAIIAECGRQYDQYTWWRILTYLSAPGMIGLAIYFLVAKSEMALRSKVADLGMDAEVWEKRQWPRRERTFLIFFGSLGSLVVLGALIGITFELNAHRSAQTFEHSSQASESLKSIRTGGIDEQIKQVIQQAEASMAAAPTPTQHAPTPAEQAAQAAEAERRRAELSNLYQGVRRAPSVYIPQPPPPKYITRYVGKPKPAPNFYPGGGFGGSLGK